MKTLIVYDSRHGFTEKCVGLLTGELPSGVDLWPLKERPGVPDWSAYDVLLFGGPVYFGQWAPRVMRFLKRHQASLSPERLHLGAFVVSLSPRAAALRYFSQGLLPEWKGKLGHVSHFGGGITWRELSWWERVLLKRVRKIETDVSNLSLAEIQGLAAWVTAQGSANGAPA